MTPPPPAKQAPLVFTPPPPPPVFAQPPPPTEKGKERVGKPEVKQAIEATLYSPEVPTKIKMIASDLIANIEEFKAAGDTLLKTAQTVAPATNTVEQAEALAPAVPEVLAKPAVRFAEAETRVFEKGSALAQQPNLPPDTKLALKSILKTLPEPEKGKTRVGKPQPSSLSVPLSVPAPMVISQPELREQFIDRYRDAEGKRVKYEYNRIITKMDTGEDATTDIENFKQLVDLREQLNVIQRQVPQLFVTLINDFKNKQADPAISLNQVLSDYKVEISKYTKMLNFIDSHAQFKKQTQILLKIANNEDVSEDIRQLTELTALQEKLDELQKQFAGEQFIEEKIDKFKADQTTLSVAQEIANYKAAVPLYRETLRLYKLYLAEVAPLREATRTEARNKINTAIREKLFAGQLQGLEQEIRDFALEERSNFFVEFGSGITCMLAKYTCLKGGDLIKLLGKGAYGATYNACVNNNCEYVVKVQRDNAEFRNELSVFKQLRGWPGIQLLNNIVCEGNCGPHGTLKVGVLVLEKWDGDIRSDLAWQIVQQNIDEFVRQLGDQIRYLHGIGYIHWDLFKRNVLYKGLRFTMVDFGVANTISASTLFPFGGTIERVGWLQRFNMDMEPVYRFLKGHTLELANATNWLIVDYYLVMYAILTHPSLTDQQKVRRVVDFLSKQQNTGPIIAVL